AQRLARLGAAVVKLARLADDNRSGANEQDFFQVGALRHLLAVLSTMPPGVFASWLHPICVAGRLQGARLGETNSVGCLPPEPLESGASVGAGARQPRRTPVLVEVAAQRARMEPH